jgi:Domain of unknown function (DUF4234)
MRQDAKGAGMSDPMQQQPVPQTPTSRPVRPVGVQRSAGLTIFLTIITLGIWSLVWSYLNAEEMKRYRGQGLGGVITLILAIFINPVVWFTLANEVEQLYREDGREPPITTIWGLWFLLPIIGNFVWYLRMQRSLNEFWASKS